MSFVESIIISFIASLGASCIWYYALMNVNEWRNKRNVFNKIATTVYDHKRMDYGDVGNYSTFEYESPNTFHIKTFSKKEAGIKLDWEGKIEMNELRPRYGDGTFNYPNMDQWGKISILVKDDGEIFVRSTHLEKPNGNQPQYLMVPQEAE